MCVCGAQVGLWVQRIGAGSVALAPRGVSGETLADLLHIYSMCRPSIDLQFGLPSPVIILGIRHIRHRRGLIAQQPRGFAAKGLKTELAQSFVVWAVKYP